VLAVAHKKFAVMGGEIRALGKPAHVLYDLKYVLPTAAADLCLLHFCFCDTNGVY